jgi:hypothetical protein
LQLVINFCIKYILWNFIFKSSKIVCTWQWNDYNVLVMIFTVWCTEIKLNHTLISHGYDSIGMFCEKVMISQDQVMFNDILCWNFRYLSFSIFDNELKNVYKSYDVYASR